MIKRNVCYYCGLPMKNANDDGNQIRRMLGITKGSFKSRKLLRYMKETDEHLVRVAEGGLYTRDNIVKAHMWCNSIRAGRSVKEHKLFIRASLDDGSHPLSALKRLETP